MILGIQPRPLKILISDASLIDRNQPSSYEVPVLLNRTVSEGLDAICKQSGHVASEQQLETLSKYYYITYNSETHSCDIEGDKLIDSKSFETQQIKEYTELILTPKTEDVTDGTY